MFSVLQKILTLQNSSSSKSPTRPTRILLIKKNENKIKKMKNDEKRQKKMKKDEKREKKI
jgi:hypothetical protein